MMYREGEDIMDTATKEYMNLGDLVIDEPVSIMNPDSPVKIKDKKPRKKKGGRPKRRIPNGFSKYFKAVEEGKLTKKDACEKLECSQYMYDIWVTRYLERQKYINEGGTVGTDPDELIFTDPIESVFPSFMPDKIEPDVVIRTPLPTYTAPVEPPVEPVEEMNVTEECKQEEEESYFESVLMKLNDVSSKIVSLQMDIVFNDKAAKGRMESLENDIREIGVLVAQIGSDPNMCMIMSRYHHILDTFTTTWKTFIKKGIK